MSSSDTLPAAALVYAASGGVDDLLAAFARDLQARGLRVRGLLQRPDPGGTVLLDLATGERYPLFQDLGRGSGACSVDSASVAAASITLRRALGEDADLVLVNRYGPLEAAGGGFAAEMLALMSEGVPLLTAVAERNLAEWRHFTGGTAAELPPRPEAIAAWFAGLGR